MPLLVGESPSRSGDRFWRLPLSGAPARVLCQCAGWEADGPAAQLGSWTWALYSRFETVNTIERYADASPWSAPRARERGEAIWVAAVRERRPSVVLLGRRVAAAFGLVDVDFFAWRGGGGVAMPRVVVLPHPSGRNLLLNEPRTRERIGRALREAVDGPGADTDPLASDGPSRYSA